ncbi:hypothetical protein BUALT_Bualt18G0014500 [Buddleja alternifolia]|uniref:Uncharacterized protein n=1 Tax=Buddleja alternifolia TaxID=168488 RepID=A0AAV6W2Y9_9LAMI|nr:hypothetical protein BUALT_Bualt18G0014500 [Buddleja alternifolia]
MSSSMNKNINISEEPSEESGWTAYFEDFSCSKGSFISSPSLVSDAAWNGSDSNLNQIKRLNFKNSKKNKYRKYSCDDEDLEDTASSPVNSPKVSCMKQMEVNHKRFDDFAVGNFMGKQGGPSDFEERRADEKNGKNDIDNRNNKEYVDLKKRGLCLMPMSALGNYLG